MDKAQFEHMKRKRGAVKGKLTTFKNQLNRLKQKYEGNENKLEENEEIELLDRLTNAAELLGDYENLHFEILSYTDVNIDEETIDYDEFSNAFYAAIADAKVFLNKRGLNTKDERNLQISTNNNQNQGSTVPTDVVPRNSLQSIKLPQITLPSFSGNYEDWLEYKDTFDSLINNNPLIHNNIDKFHYLRASLSGNALQVIKSLEFSATNYDVAWKLLCERYDNNRLLVKNHVRALFEVERVNKGSASEIRNLIDSFAKNLRCLQALNENVDSWDTLIIHLITTKLDSLSLEEWEKRRDQLQQPNLEDLKSFLKSRCALLETIESNKKGGFSDRIKTDKKNIKTTTKTLVATQPKCICCKGEHYLQNCNDFLKLNISDRINKVKQLQLCINCLRPGHVMKNCKSGNCKKCNSKHNSLLHLENDSNKSQPENKQEEVVSTVLSSSSLLSVLTLLPTALIQIANIHGQFQTVRALLDSASQSNYITSDLCKQLQLPTKNVSVSVRGINQSHSSIKSKCLASVASNHSDFKIQLHFLVISQITGDLPNFSINPNNFDIPINIQLADPSYYKAGEVQVLLGAEIFFKILRVGQQQLSNGVILQNSHLGWIVSGSLNIPSHNSIEYCYHSQNIDLDKQVSRFWTIHEPPTEKLLSQEEKQCEIHFKTNVTTNLDGRFIVSLPFKRSVSELGNSREIAEKRFSFLERKFKRNPSLKEKYCNFMREYEIHGHMSLIPNSNLTQSGYYIPHHGVINENSLTTKLRVVFDASCRSNTGVSLNDLLMVGPVLQEDLVSILIRFRQHAIVISADIEKMYRQVLINSNDRKFQRILWRYDSSEPVCVYELNTITYGTSSASFLAIRCLHQVAIDCEDTNPNISNIIKRDFYVDDLLTGSQSFDDAKQIVASINSILKQRCFPLKKWVSNKPEILEDISETDKTSSIINLNPDSSLKTLGLKWNPTTDCLSFSINTLKSNSVTKRNILSEIAQIFDPLGLVSPCTIISKILLQKVWVEKLDWDSHIPHALSISWLTYRDNLSLLNNLSISRFVLCDNFDSNTCIIELHGFSDASESAYGACIYIRTIDTNEKTRVNLLIAKAKVAPLKTTTISRLELCGALVLVNLLETVKNSLTIPIASYTCWTDSIIVLGWINTSPHLLQTYVGNRVSQIQSSTIPTSWNHVTSQDNPADLLSRGVTPSNLLENKFWWHGPTWLSKPTEYWPESIISKIDLPELKKISVNLNVTYDYNYIFNRLSKLSKLHRVVAYCLRFVYNCKLPNDKRERGPLTLTEIKQASYILIKCSQHQSFTEELVLLKKSNSHKLPNQFARLKPFIDKTGIIRVGGRLQNSALNFRQKHPILLSSKHRYTQLLFEHEHRILLHAAPQLLLSTIRQNFWPLQGRSLARKVYHNCIKCYRVSPKNVNPIMGNLPYDRVNISSPFHITGVDYGGPFLIKDRPGRGAKLTKCYIAVFICFSTKAIHLELVSSLSSECFIAALRRFVSRRGLPKRVYSDNGTTFVGANSELKELGKFLRDSTNCLVNAANLLNIEWKFIPAYSPHFGGIWEAGVKSTKYHLKRVASNASLTFEEFSTLLSQIEAILNYRPLIPLSAEPDDLQPLTPAHFLVGRPLNAVPDENVQEIKENRLSRFQRVQQLTQHFWSRWEKEYLNELQSRNKWFKSNSNLTVGTMVLLKNENRPPLSWPLGRIIEVFVGSDGVVRVAKVRTANGITQRAVAKLCPLPIEENIDMVKE